MERLAIIGAGDLGKQIAHHAKDACLVPVGFFDDTLAQGDQVSGVPVLGGTDTIKLNFKEGSFDVLMVGIGYKHMDFRASLCDRLGEIPFATMVHSSVHLDPTVQVGKGTIILPGCVIDAGVKVGQNVLINVGTVIAHDSHIGDHTFISPAVKIAGFTTVGSKCNIGIGSILIDNIKIADDIQTGGGTVVIKDLQEPGLYVASPARYVK